MKSLTFTLELWIIVLSLWRDECFVIIRKCSGHTKRSDRNSGSDASYRSRSWSYSQVNSVRPVEIHFILKFFNWLIIPTTYGIFLVAKTRRNKWPSTVPGGIWSVPIFCSGARISSVGMLINRNGSLMCQWLDHGGVPSLIGGAAGIVQSCNLNNNSQFSRFP